MEQRSRVPRQGIAFLPLLPLICLLLSCNAQKADPQFHAGVATPAYLQKHPRILFDEAHNNIHKSKGTYRPFAELLAIDGYALVPNETPFTTNALNGFDILVISNAKGKERKYDPAFTREECDAVEHWVRAGGSLLLVADHFPLGSAAEALSLRFGVRMSKGFTSDSLHYDTSVSDKSQLVFSRENGLLGEHPILQGRDSSERIRRIVTFTGQSLAGPAGSSALLPLGASATDEVPDSVWEQPEWIFFSNTYTRYGDPVSARGRAQGIALTFGMGRVVVLGEAAMLTAQVSGEDRFGMQLPGNDDRQFALNVMHWLSRLL